jgi:uncharacterized protein (TIGR03118 family)
MRNLPVSRQAMLACATLALAPCLAVADDSDHESGWSHDFYENHVLVSDGFVPADFPDPNLVNAWGVAFNPQAVVWVADADKGKSTLYDGTGKPVPLVVTIPPAPGEETGSPTGIVYSGGMDFVVTGKTDAGAVATGPARFLFATEGGQIDGWAPNITTATAFLAVNSSPGGAIYKGLALGGNGTTHLLYAADFHNARVDVFDGTFKPARLPAGAFTDRHIPNGYAPFGIQAINGDIVVTYAKQDAAAEDDVAGRGFGFVDIFDPNGKLVQRVAERGVLNAPWGIALAPASFGRFGGALLIGNFGDGTINAFGPISGHFLGSLRDSHGRRVHIDGLWGMQFGNGLLQQDTNALFAAAGPDDEQHGTYNVIHARSH